MRTTRALLVLIVVVLTASSVARAEVPPGFREAPQLEPAASYVAGKPVKVWCGVTELGDVYEAGYADRIGGDNIFLTPSLVCAPLQRLAERRTVTSGDAGPAITTLVHESEHAKGVADESVADCTALRMTAEIGIRFFGLRGRARFLHDMTAAAWAGHREMPASYTRLC